MVNWIEVSLVATTLLQQRLLYTSKPADIKFDFPSALKFNNTYFVFTSDIQNGLVSKIHVSTSTDLVNWKYDGVVLDDRNAPKWVTDNINYPSIHQVGSQFLLYFSAANNSAHAAGLAIATHPLGPYKSIEYPLWVQSIMVPPDPTLVNDQGKLYLMFARDQKEIVALPLNSDGHTVSSQKTISLLKPSFNWEENIFQCTQYLRRGNYHYIFYSSFMKDGFIGVARSRFAMGPYEKFPAPFIKSDSKYYFALGLSIVKDLDDSHLIFFRRTFKRPDKTRQIIIGAISWDSDEWPYVEV